MSEVIATIGNYSVTDKDVENFIASLPREQQMYKDIPAFRDQVKEKVIEMALFAMLGEEEKVKESEEYKETMRTAEREILSQITLSKLLKDAAATEEEMKDYYESNKGQFTKGPEAGAKHILVDSEEKAESIKADIEAGKISFEDAAKENSSCPSKAKGGDLGTFSRGQMVPEFDEVTFTGELDKVLGPVKTQFGYHLITIYSRTEGSTAAFDEVKEQVEGAVIEFKQMKLYNEKLEELKKKYM